MQLWNALYIECTTSIALALYIFELSETRVIFEIKRDNNKILKHNKYTIQK